MKAGALEFLTKPVNDEDRHVRIRRLPGSERDHGGGRSGTWSQRSVNMSQMTVSQMSIRNTTPSPQQRQHWLSANVCLIQQ
jgi:hypothetical protein